MSIDGTITRGPGTKCYLIILESRAFDPGGILSVLSPEASGRKSVQTLPQWAI